MLVSLVCLLLCIQHTLHLEGAAQLYAREAPICKVNMRQDNPISLKSVHA